MSSSQTFVVIHKLDVLYRAVMGKPLDLYDVARFDPQLGAQLEKMWAALQAASPPQAAADAKAAGGSKSGKGGKGGRPRSGSAGTLINPLISIVMVEDQLHSLATDEDGCPSITADPVVVHACWYVALMPVHLANKTSCMCSHHMMSSCLHLNLL
jgi:hypothetical protein